MSRLPKRRLVLVIGPRRIDKGPFGERDLDIDRFKADDLTVRFGATRALLIAEREGDFAKVQSHFSSTVVAAEQHGIPVAILASSKGDLKRIANIQEFSGRCRNVAIFLYRDLSRAAEFIARSTVAPIQMRHPMVLSPDFDLKPEQRVLLDRAFSDCQRIRLEPLSGGKAADAVFRVHAECVDAAGGPWPLPYFAKFGECKLIEDEQEFYRTHAESYIPFNLRPNLEHRRCVRGSHYSAIVGNFAEDAAPLRDVLRVGGGSGVLYSLFEVSLRGIRMQAFANEKAAAISEEFIKRRVKGKLPAWEIAAPILSHAKRRFGFRTTPADMFSHLVALGGRVECRWGPIHGDLHAGNVMVRRGDAIVIDFGSIANGPPTTDLASLEVNLAFGSDSGRTAKSFTAWKRFVDHCYHSIPDIRPPNLAVDTTGFAWLRRAVREIRHMALGCDGHKDEYAVTLASELMRISRIPTKASLKKSKDSHATARHAYALVVANRIIQALLVKKK